MNFFEDKPDIRLLIFDLDGTLIDSGLDLALSVNAALQHLGRPALDHDTIFSYVGRGAPDLIDQATGGDASEEEIERGLHFFLRYYWDHKLDNTRLYPGVREALGQLAEASGQSSRSMSSRSMTSRTMAVLTNKPENVSRDIIAGLELDHLFSYIFGGNSFSTKKPDPIGIHHLLSRTGLSVGEAMIVGDSDVDIQAGSGAGIWTCGVSYGFGSISEEENPPHLMVETLSGLTSALLSCSMPSR